jgi:hypothetical protein
MLASKLSTNFSADRDSQGNQRHNQEILTLHNIINDHPSASFGPLKFHTHESKWAALSLNPVDYSYDCSYPLNPHVRFAITKRQD